MRVAIYLRVSTQHEEQDSSIENQRKLLTSIIESNKDILVNEYVDRFTGTSLNRPSFTELLLNCGIRYNSKNKVFYIDDTIIPSIDYIYVTNTSRLGRTKELFQILNLLEKQNIGVRFIQDNLDTKDSSGRVLLSILQIFDSEESVQKSDRIRTGIEQSIKRGKRSGNKIYGYDYIDNTYTVNKEEANIVKRIFELYSNNIGYIRIANTLNKDSIQSCKGKEWSRAMVANIIKNEAYIGNLYRGKYQTNKLKDTKRVILDDNKCTKLTITPIIPQELWDKCQNLRRSKQDTDNINKFCAISKYGKLIKCEVCGNYYQHYIYSTKSGKVSSYRCYGKINKICNNSNIKESVLDSIITKERINNIRDRVKLLRLTTVNRGINKLKESLNTDNTLKIQKLQTEYEDLSNKQAKLLDLYLNGNLDKDLFTSKSDELKEQLSSIANKIEELSKSKGEIECEIQRRVRILQNIKTDSEEVELNKVYIKDKQIQLEIKMDDFIFRDEEWIIY